MPAGSGCWFCWRSGPAMNRAPTAIAAISAAARPAIHTGPLRSGASTSAECTRAVRLESGGPAMDSKPSRSSRRKSSGPMSENLLHRKLGAKSLGRAVDARLRRRLGNSERAGDLVQRKVEIEMQHKREAFVRLEPQQRSPHIAGSAAVVISGVFAARWLGQPHDRPPLLPPRHAALIGDDRQEP